MNLIYRLITEHPEPAVQRSLVLATKLIQGVANQAPFEKEVYMMPFNDFVSEEKEKLASFFSSLLVTTRRVRAFPYLDQ